MDRLIALWALIFVRPMLALGALAAVIGIGLVVFAGGYFALGAYEQAGLDDLAVTQAESGLTQADLTRDLATATALPAPTFTPAATATASPTTGNPADAAPRTPEIVPRTPAAEPTPEDSPYDEYGILRDFSHYLAEAEDGTLLRPIAENFRAVTRDDLFDTYGEQPKPAHIIIPAIGLDSGIIDLNIVWDGETGEWETADRVVGFHVGSASPGEIGNTVMSGHVNSPFAGEGSIFARLDEVAPLLRRGEIVDIVVMAGGDVFLYRATDTTVVLPEEVDVFDYSDTPTLSLVTCAPATTYSHRFIVNATLVGVGRL